MSPLFYKQTAALFKYNYDASAHVVINQGGTSSGKTYAIQQVLFCLAYELPKQVITVVGQDIPNIKSGVLRDAQTILADAPLLKRAISKFNNTDRLFEFKNGSGCCFAARGRKYKNKH
jgi:phage terminase large subunit